MLVYKVIFWLFVFNGFIALIHALADHPRTINPVSIEVDFISLLVSIGLIVWLGMEIVK